MKNKLLTVLVIAAMSVFGFGVSAYAQEAAAPAENAAAAADAPASEAGKAQETQKIAGKSLMDMWKAGGMTMYPLGFCAIAGMALAIVNFISIRPVKFAKPEDIKSLEGLLNNVDVAAALEYCEKHPSPLTNIVGAGLARVNEKEKDWESIEEAMEEASLEEMSGPYVMINYLALIASISPMLGLFGTVTGMVKAFNTIAAEGAGSAQKLADNISEALITTAAGMIVGIPAMFFFFFFKNQYGKVASGISRIIGDLMYTFKLSSKYGPQQLEEVSENS